MTTLPEPSEGAERDIRPAVRRVGVGLPGWLLAAFAVFGALVLFVVLDARRRQATAPSVAVGPVDAEFSSSVPQLYIPSEQPEPVPQPEIIYSRPLPPPIVPQRTEPQVTPPMARYPSYVEGPPQAPPQATLPVRAPNAGGAVLTVDNSVPRTPGASAQNNPATATAPPASPGGGGRARASMLANRATTVPQGTLIFAVLESAFDSTRPGFARAIVSRSVMSFDGTRVLIPRGSRVIGEYSAETTPGQKRALILWTRLIRDDGATIEVGSPAADPVGRGGVRAKVDNHFFERFSGAILQSALDIGVNVASRAASGTVILALPNSIGSSASQVSQPQPIQPTLKVEAGTSISIFVAKDLDFTDVETAP
jgi:type IV secretion system protein VirB10